MTTNAPNLYSVWQNNDGEKFIVTDAYDPSTDEHMAGDDYSPGYFLVTLSAYEHRFDTDVSGLELDNEQWTHFVNSGFRQVGIEPGEYVI